MNKIFKTLAFAVVATALISCDKDAKWDNNDIDINVPSDGYIFFDTELGTRGELVYDYLKADFRVLGYRYETLWENHKSSIAQDKTFVYKWIDNNGEEKTETVNYGIFRPEADTISGNSYAQLVKWNATSGVHEYTPLKEWNIAFTYSFFAWYPSSLVPCDGEHEGNPYITYTLDRTDPTNHVDVMTACNVDTRPGQSKSVALEMNHRLSALDIIARSYVNDAAVGMDDGTGAKVKLDSISLKLDGIMYDNVRIPLNTKPDNNGYVEPMVGSRTGESTIDWGGLSRNNRLILYYSGNSDVVALTNENNKTMLLIPQNSELNCYISYDYTIVDGNDNDIWDDIYKGMDNADIPAKTATQKITLKKLQEGTYYNLLLTFTKSGVTIIVLEADEWTDKPVKHQFE